MDGPTLDEGGNAYPLVRDVVKGAAVNANWEQLDVSDYIGVGQ